MENEGSREGRIGAKIGASKTKNALQYPARHISVEVSGLEPLSKRRAWRLSTRLSVLCFSCRPCRMAGEDGLILCVLAGFKGVRRSVPVWMIPLGRPIPGGTSEGYSSAAQPRRRGLS